MLLGDASVDPRNYMGTGTYDYVPTRMVITALLRTASDDWFTDFNNDGIADIPIGRIPVRTAAEARSSSARSLRAERRAARWSSNALFVADYTTDYDFGRCGEVAHQAAAVVDHEPDHRLRHDAFAAQPTSSRR